MFSACAMVSSATTSIKCRYGSRKNPCGIAERPPVRYVKRYEGFADVVPISRSAAVHDLIKKKTFLRAIFVQ